MKTIELNTNYDIFVQDGNLAVQRNALECIRQTIVNTLSLVQGEDLEDPTNGLNLNIIFGDNISYANKVAEIERVIYSCPNVSKVNKISMEVDKNLRIGYFTCYITVNINNETADTVIGFGI